MNSLARIRRPRGHDLDCPRLGRVYAARRAGKKSSCVIHRNCCNLCDPVRCSRRPLRTRVHRNLLDLAATEGEALLEVRAPVALMIKVELEPGKPASIEWIEELDWKAYVQALRVHTIEHTGQIRRAARQGPS